MPNRVVAITACLLGAAPFTCFATDAGEAPAAPYVPCSLVDPDARHPGDAVWVDTRGAAEFRRYWIPGSTNVPLYAIKTTSLIRNRRTTHRFLAAEPLVELGSSKLRKTAATMQDPDQRVGAEKVFNGERLVSDFYGPAAVYLRAAVAAAPPWAYLTSPRQQ
ncbi:MAG: hypothetical protein ACR2RB_10505, partial [Gammaproteobacteria bacterium]